MNCVRCNVPLEENARFCRNCGLPVAASQTQQVLLAPTQEQATEETIRIAPLIEQLQSQNTQQYVPQSYQQQTQRQQQIPVPSQSPLDYYQPRATGRAGSSRAAVVNASRRRSPVGCILGCLGTLIVFVLLLAATWIFALRPYIHDAAVTQMDTAMASAVNQIPPVAVPISPGKMIQIPESTVNALLTSNSTGTDAIQDTNIQITPNQMLLDLKAYGQDCTITAIPQEKNGALVATNVTVSGIVSLVISPKDITNLLDKHLQEAQARIGHNISSVHLLDHEIDVTFQ